MSKSFKWLVPLLFAIALWLPMPAFAEADVTNVGTTGVVTSTEKIIVVHQDYKGPDGRGDVGSPLGNAGWDFQILTATVDVDFNLNIFAKAECRVGDADCDGDPRGTSKALSDLGGGDLDWFDNNSTESYVFGIGREKLDYVCGVSAERQDNVLRCSPSKPGSVWYEPQFAFPLDVQVPWLYSIGILSDTAYLKFNLKNAYSVMPDQIKIVLYAGSQQDSGVGEDYLPNSIMSGGAITVPVPAILGDHVWNDSNANGIQDQGEQGVQGWSVELQTCSGQSVQMTTTDANGNYQFLVASGVYQIKFGTIASWKISPQNQSDDDKVDSDADQTGLTPCLTLMPGESNMTIDMGIWMPASIGDYCWLDQNSNGRQDKDEKPLKGCQVELRNEVGKPLQTVLTDGNGFYTFEVTAGKYCLFAKLPEASPYTFFTFPSQGGFDMDSNAIRETGELGCYELSAGENRDDIDVGILALPVDLWIYKTSDPTTVKAGDEITVTIFGGNNGPGTAMSAVFTDTLPAELKLQDMPFGDCTFAEAEKKMVCPIGNLTANGLFTLTYHVRAETVFSDTLATNEIDIKSRSKDTDLGNDAANSDVLISLDETPQSHKLFMPLCQNGNGPAPADPCIAYRQLPVEVTYMKPVTWTQNSLGEWEAIGVYTTTKKFTLEDGDTRTVADVSFLPEYRTCLRNLSDPYIPWYVKIYGASDSYLPSTAQEICYNPGIGHAALLKKFNITWGQGDLAHYDGRPESCQYVAGVDIDVDP